MAQACLDNSAAEPASLGSPQHISPKAGAEGVEFRSHKRKAAIPNIRLSDLFEPNVDVLTGSVVGSVALEELSRDGTDETKDDKDLVSSAIGPEITASPITGSPAVLSASKLKEHSPRSTGGSADELGRIKPPNRRLKLKVSRGALAKARRTTGSGTSPASSFASYDSGSSPGGAGNRNVAPAPASTSPPTRPCGKYYLITNANNKVPSTLIREPPPASAAATTTPPDAILTAPSPTITDINDTSPIPDNRALRRLQRRFPDLEARLAEVRQASATFSTKGVAASSSKDGETRTELRRSGRFRGRMAGWVKRVRRVIGRAGFGVGAGLGERGRGQE